MEVATSHSPALIEVLTVTVQLAVLTIEPCVAVIVIVVDPALTPVTTPLLVTVAIDVLLLLYENVGAG